MEGIRLVEPGNIEECEVICPCCNSKYIVELRNRPDSDIIITMETCEFGYVPTLFMKCKLCLISFKTALLDKDMDSMEKDDTEEDDDIPYGDFNYNITCDEGGGL